VPLSWGTIGLSYRKKRRRFAERFYQGVDGNEAAPTYRMWSSASLTAPSSGRHSCFSKSDCSCALALSASVMNSRRVRKANLQTSQ